MANQRVTDRPLASSISLSDLFHIVDTGDLSQNPAGSSYKATINQLKTAISGPFGIPNANGVYTYYPKLRDAVNAATVGQTVEVFADYTETDTSLFGIVTLKNNVDINFNGHTYTYNDGGVVNTAPFIDNSLPVNCTLLNGTIKRIGSVVGTGVSGCLQINGISTITTNCTFISNWHTLLLFNSGATVNGGKYYSTGQPRGVVVLEGSTLNNAYVELSFSPLLSNGIAVDSTAGAPGGTINNCVVYSFNNRPAIRTLTTSQILNTYVNSVGIGITTSTGCAISNSTIENSVSASTSVIMGSDSLLTNTSLNVTPTSFALQLGGNSEMLNCSVKSTSSGITVVNTGVTISNTTVDSVGICFTINTSVDIYNCVGVSSSQPVLSATTNSGVLPIRIKNSSFTSLSAVTIDNPTNNLMEISNSVIECKRNTNAVAISLYNTSGHTIVNNHLKIPSGAGGRVITSSNISGALTKIANNVYENGSPFNIAQQITTTQDNKGNIRYL